MPRDRNAFRRQIAALLGQRYTPQIDDAAITTREARHADKPRPIRKRTERARSIPLEEPHAGDDGS